MSAELHVGRVVAAHGQRGMLEFPDGTRRSYVLKGRRLKAVCGDRVQYEELAGSDGIRVLSVLPRSNELARPSPRDGRPEVIAANLTRLLVVCAAEPAPDLFLIDRYLCAGELLDCQPALIWNKADRHPVPPAEFSDYRALGYPILCVSAKDGSRQHAILELLAGQLGVMVGQSGAGKSSLINALLPGAAVATGELSAATAEGRHTTTASILYVLEGNAALVDTPGVRDFIPLIPADRNVASGFAEMRALAPDCRFTDCRHLREPGCAVKNAVKHGSVSERRYKSYLRLLQVSGERERAAQPW